MDSAHMVLFGLFAVVAYFIVTDESVAAAFFYVTRLVKAYIDRQYWWLMNNPRNPVVKYLIYRRSLKTAEKMLESIKKHQSESDA
jgi:hypothetical protein